MSGCTAENPCAECKRRIAFIAGVDGVTEQETVRQIERGDPAYLRKGLMKTRW